MTGTFRILHPAAFPAVSHRALALIRSPNHSAAGFQELVDQLEVEPRVFGMKMFDELIAEHQICTAEWDAIQMIAIVDDQFQVIRAREAGAPLVGNVDSIHNLHIAGDLNSKTAVPGRELHENGGRGEEISDESHLVLIGRTGDSFIGSPRQARMIWHLTEELIIHGGMDMSSLFPARILEPRGYSFFNHVLVVNLFDGAIDRKLSEWFHLAQSVWIQTNYDH
ncbi:MAG: hypothetical protein P8181_00600 [bacterium]